MRHGYLLLSSAVFLFTACHFPATVQAQSTSDWYMAGANPQRTSWVSEEVRGNLNIEWYQPIEPYIPYKVQPVFAENTAYISTAKGLYALDLSSTYPAGVSRVKWVYPTELPLGHTPTVVTVNNQLTIFVAGYDKKIHAIDAQTGKLLSGYTPYPAGAGFETNPLIVSNTIYAGNRDGNFYALDAINGSLKWKYQTAGPVLFSAAYKDGLIYFASNDMHAYALNASNGALVWKSQKFSGQGFHSYWPVIYTEKTSGKDYVSFTTGENYIQRVMGLPQEETYTLFADIPVGQLIGSTSSSIAGDWTSGTVTMDVSIITNYFQNRPDRRTVFLLDRATGQEYTFDSNNDGTPEYAPFTWSPVTHSGSKYPPVINGIDNVYYQGTAYYNHGWVSRGGPVGWKFGTHYVSRVDGNDIGHASDEPMAYSSGGKLIHWALCCDREAGAFDITIPHGQSDRAWNYYIYNLANNVLAPGYQAMYNNGTSSYNDLNGWQLYSGKNQSKNGVYGKHSLTQSPPIPYRGKLYFLKGNSLMAFSPTATASQTPLPLALSVSTRDTVSLPTKAQLREVLETQIQKILSAGHLRPGYHAAGFIDLYGSGGYTDDRAFGEIFDYFQSPADTVYHLLLAYPHLSPATQVQLKTYLQTHYGPGATYDFTKIVHIGWGTGAAREVYEIPPELSTWWGQQYKPPFNPSTKPTCGWCGYWQNFPPFSFYAAWKYTQIVGNNDPVFAKTIFDLMASKLETPLADDVFIKKPYWLNLYISGYLGYLELQKLAGYPQDQTKLLTYQRLLSLRVNNFSKDTPFPLPGADKMSGYNNTLAVSRNFMFMTPELAEYLRQTIFSQVKEAYDEYTYVAPYWFVSKFDDSYGEGTFQSLYDYSSLFIAKSWVLKEPYEELVRYLDVPAFERGDLFYIQNLVASLEAPSDPNYTPAPTAPPPLPGDLDGDGDVDFLDLQALLGAFNSIASFNLIGDPIINLFDLNKFISFL